MSGPEFTLEEDAIMLRVEALMPRKAVAFVMGRSVTTVSRRLDNLRGQHKAARTPPPPPVVIKPRKCLTHGGYFVPKHGKIFVCNPCKSKANWRDGQWMLEAS